MWDRKKRKVKQIDVENLTVLGKGVTFKGVLCFEGTVQLDGCIEGEIHSNGVLVVGKQALIRGTISVGTLISSGKILGTVAAADKVRLLKSAVQIGNVQAPTFSIEEGAYFKGYADRNALPVADESSQHNTQLPDQVIRHDSQSLRIPEQESVYEQLAHNLSPDELVLRTMTH